MSCSNTLTSQIISCNNKNSSSIPHIDNPLVNSNTLNGNTFDPYYYHELQDVHKDFLLDNINVYPFNSYSEKIKDIIENDYYTTSDKDLLNTLREIYYESETLMKTKS